MNSTPRVEARSGSSTMARHSGQLPTLASHKLTTAARVRGFRGASIGHDARRRTLIATLAMP